GLSPRFRRDTGSHPRRISAPPRGVCDGRGLEASSRPRLESGPLVIVIDLVGQLVAVVGLAREVGREALADLADAGLEAGGEVAGAELGAHRCRDLLPELGADVGVDA